MPALWTSQYGGIFGGSYAVPPAVYLHSGLVNFFDSCDVSTDVDVNGNPYTGGGGPGPAVPGFPALDNHYLLLSDTSGINPGDTLTIRNVPGGPINVDFWPALYYTPRGAPSPGTLTALGPMAVGEAVDIQLDPNGGYDDGSYVFTITSGALPDGVSMDALGHITGTPTTLGESWACSIELSDDSVGDDFSIVFSSGFDDVVVDVLPLEITPTTLPDAVVGEVYSETISATGGDGGPYTFTLDTTVDGTEAPQGALPGDLVLDEDTGDITGTCLIDDTFTFTVKVEDGDGNIARQEYTIEVTAGSPDPVYTDGPRISAGPDMVAVAPITSTPVDLEGEIVSDTDGLITTWLWEQIDGPTAVIDDPSSPVTFVTFSVIDEGRWTFRLTASGPGMTDVSDTMVITIGTHVAPRVKSAAIRVSPPVTDQVLDLVWSDDGLDEDPAEFLWEFVSGPTTPVISDPTVENPTVDLPADEYGNYLFRFTVTTGTESGSGTLMIVAASQEANEQFDNRRLYISIGGVEHAADPADLDEFVMHNTTQIQKNDDSADTASFDVFGFMPSYGQRVVIRLDDEIKFTGIILNDDRDYPEGHIFAIQTVYCIDNSWHLTRRKVYKVYRNASASTIAEDIIAIFAPYGLTANVDLGLEVLEDFVIEGADGEEALTALAEKIGADWKVDDYDVFFGMNRPVAQPEPLTPFHPSMFDFSIQRDISQIINRVRVGWNYVDPARRLQIDEVEVDSLDGYDSGGGEATVDGQTFTYTGTRTDYFPLNLSGTISVRGTWDKAGELSAGTATYNTFERTWLPATDAPTYRYYFTLRNEQGETSTIVSASNSLGVFFYGNRPSYPIFFNPNDLPDWLKAQNEDAEQIKGLVHPGSRVYTPPPPAYQNAMELKYPFELPLNHTIRVYRTEADSTGLAYYVGEMGGGESFIDTISDADLVNGEVLPTEDTATLRRFYLTGCSTLIPEVVTQKFFTLDDEDSQDELATLLGDDGVIEGAIFVDDAFTEEAARRVGEAYLSVMSPVFKGIKVSTRDPNTEAGSTLVVDMEDLSDTLRIKTVQISDFESIRTGDDAPEGRVSPVYKIQAQRFRTSFEDLLARMIGTTNAVTVGGSVSVSGGIGGGSAGGGSTPGPIGPAGPQGPPGATGAQGPAGPTTVDVGDTITGLPGTDASVENVGTTTDAVLEFTIPRGATGPTGPAGAPGVDDVFDQDENGLVPGPTSAEIAANKVLRADGTWVAQSGGGGAAGTWSILTNGNSDNPEIVYDTFGNVIPIFTPE